MVCYLMFVNLVKQLTGVSDDEAEQILRDIESEVGHNVDLIKAIVDAEGEALRKRLRKKAKQKEEKSIAYG